MLINLVLQILGFPLILLSWVGGVINLVLPSWLTTTIQSVMGGSGPLNTLLPMYPHVGMAGLAGQLGIMTLFGWLVILMGYLIQLTLAYKLVKVFIGILPWHTGGASIGTGGR
jgi:hypothetical protein